MSEQKSVASNAVNPSVMLRNAHTRQRNEKMFNELTADEQIAIILRRHREIVSSLVTSA